MNVELDPREQRKIEALASATGKDPGELLRELVHEALEIRARNGDALGDEADLLARQREALRALHARIDPLPVHSHTDGLSGSRDHDAILYGKRS
jgi:hypothetical protein